MAPRRSLRASSASLGLFVALGPGDTVCEGCDEQ